MFAEPDSHTLEMMLLRTRAKHDSGDVDCKLKIRAYCAIKALDSIHEHITLEQLPM